MQLRCHSLLYPALIFLTIILWSNHLIWGQQNTSQDYRYHYDQGQKALTNHDFKAALIHLRKANALRPGHQIIMFHLARAFSFNQKPDSCYYFLAKTLPIKADFDLGEGAFSAYRDTPEFQQLLSLQQELLKPVHRSHPEIILTERDLHIESVAYHPASNRFFYGSVHKQKIISSVKGQSTVQDFSSPEDKLWSVFGMKVDTIRDHLWVCSVATPYMTDWDSTIEHSSIFKYDLRTNKLLKTYPLRDPNNNHWFGDLTLSPEGDIYISDSRANTLYCIKATSDSLELFMKDLRFLSLQGLDFDTQGQSLFISDYVLGLFKIDIRSKEVQAIKTNLPDISLKSVDGLYFYKNSLITTQNQLVPMRVSRYYLNENHTGVNGVRYLEKSQPLLNEPTLGVILENTFYYVANSQWGGYDEKNQPKAWEHLQDIYIMSVEL